MRSMALWLVIMLLLLAAPAGAQTNAPFTQTQLDAVFVMGEDSVTAMYAFSYIQPSDIDEIRWLFPIPADATRVELGPVETLLILQNQTEPIIEPPETSCNLSPILFFGDGYLPTVVQHPPDGADLVRLDSSSAALDWLGDDAAVDTAALAEYEAFVGVTIAPQTEIPVGAGLEAFELNVNISPLLIVEYPGTETFLPIQLHTPAMTTRLDNYTEDGTMPLTTYIFADTPYAPSNFDAARVNLSRITGDNAIRSLMRRFGGPSIFFNELDPEYYALVQQAVDSSDGEAMITEFRQQPEWNLSGPLRRRYPDAVDLLETISANSAMVTRLRTFIRADRPIPDPRFAPAPDLDPMRIALPRTADPAWFFGCTTRTLYDRSLENATPAGRTYIAPLDLHVAHPTGWELYELDDTTFALAPEPVTLDTLRALERGEDAPPMFVLQRFTQPFVRTDRGFILPDRTWELFTEGPDSTQVRRLAQTLYYPYAGPTLSGDLPLPAEGIRMAVIAPNGTFRENERAYSTMIDYAATRQFWLSPDLRHTLFMAGTGDLVMIGYPDGWIESLDAGGRRVIAPEDAVDTAAAPAIREIVPPDRATADAWLREQYNLDATTDLRAVTPFSADGRTGFIRQTGWSNGAVIEVSASDDLYESYADLLTTIAEASRFQYPVED